MSLRDQLLKSGLASKQQAKRLLVKLKKNQHKKQRPKLKAIPQQRFCSRMTFRRK